MATFQDLMAAYQAGLVENAEREEAGLQRLPRHLAAEREAQLRERTPPAPLRRTVLGASA